jgi:hypothetical protein
MSDAIRVNGNQYSWGSIVLKFGGERFYGFTSIIFSDRRERVHAYGMGRHHAPRGRSSGKYIVEPVRLTGWRSSIAEFRRALAATSPDGVSYGDVEFVTTVHYVERTEVAHEVVMTRCVWTGNNVSDEENPDPLKEEIEINTMSIFRDGLTLFDATEGYP